MKFRWLPVLAGFIWTFGLPTLTEGQASFLVPPQDPAYRDLDVLITAGLVQEVLVGERPYSQEAFRRFIQEAQGRAQLSASPRLSDALQRLEARFGDGPARLTPTYVTGSGSLAASPDRDMRSPEVTRRGREAGLASDIDAALNPLLQRNEGRTVPDGVGLATEGGGGFQSRFLAAHVAPRVWLELPRNGGGLSAEASLVDGYVRGVLGPLAVEAGRSPLTWGFGNLGGPLISHNSRGFDMVRLATDAPIRFPGPLSHLGLWQPSIGVTDLGKDREFPGAWMVMMRLGARPIQYLEGGFSYLNIQGGEGGPEASRWERRQDIFYPWSYGSAFFFSDKVMGADLRIAVPQARASLFVNFFTTDDRGKFSQPARGYWEDALWTAGVDARGLGGEGRWDLNFQWTHAGPRAHIHHQYVSGVTIDRRTLGDPMGPNAHGVSFQAHHQGATARVGIVGAWERYSGDDWYWDLIPGGGDWDFKWYRHTRNPDEIRSRLEGEYLQHAGWRGLESEIRLGLERVVRFDYSSDDRFNVMAQWVLRHRW